MRPWYSLTWKGRGLPVEPILMVLLTSVGINAELWAGHVSWRCVCIQHCSMLQMRQRGALLTAYSKGRVCQSAHFGESAPLWVTD